MAWTEEIKNVITWTLGDVAFNVDVFRGTIEDSGVYTRGDIAELLKGNPTANITRKDMEDYWGIVVSMVWIEEIKGTVNWTQGD